MIAFLATVTSQGQPSRSPVSLFTLSGMTTYTNNIFLSIVHRQAMAIGIEYILFKNHI